MFFLNAHQVNAQADDFICLTPEFSAPDPAGVYSYETGQSRMMDPDEVKVLNVYYWQINAPDGSNPNPLSLQTVLASVAYLNVRFNPYNIFFKYRGWDEVNSPPDIIQEMLDSQGCMDVLENGQPMIDPNGFGTLSQCQRSEFWSFVSSSAEYDDAINIYVPYLTDDFAGAARGIGSDKIVVPTSNVCNTITVHEIGHALGLSHTQSGYKNSQSDCITDFESLNYTNCEHVTRNPNDGNYNAVTRGDRVTDTAAVPDFRTEYCYFTDCNATCNSASGLSRFYIDENTCEYIGNNVDCEGTPYDILPEDVRNYMSYSDRDCFDTFSPGQAIRMQETIDNNANLIAATTDIASLYEPYSGEYYSIGPLPTDIVQYRPLFQPGFDYAFFPCYGMYNEPAPYDDLSFTVDFLPEYGISNSEDNYFSITHPSGYAFLIRHPNLGNDPRRCYNNQNRRPSGGKITKFEDNTFNQNVTITPQDSIQINSNNLIQNLQPGLYKIDKNYPDGTVEEQVISKSNNE